jgi:hypothetical protein
MEPAIMIDSYLVGLGFPVKYVKVGVLDGVEQTRVAVIEKD